MNLKKSIAASAVALMLSAVTVVAQDTGNRGDGPRGRGARMHGKALGFGDPARRLERLTTILDLTDSQKQSAQSIFDKAKAQAEPLGTQAKQNRQEVSAAVKANKSDAEISDLTARHAAVGSQLAAIHAKAMRDFYALLTPTQREKLDKIQDQVRTRDHRGRRAPKTAA